MKKNETLNFGNGGLYKQFKNTLPDNLRNTPESSYAMRRYWRNSGRPASFEDAISGDDPMFSLESDGVYHAPSVSPKTLKFLKPKNHPTVQMEINWFNSSEPEAIEFRSKYDLDTSGRYYKYIPKKQSG